MNAPASLLLRHTALMRAQPALRQRDAAQQLGVSEARLLAELPRARRLHCVPQQLLPALASLGTLKAITRNQAAVHEKSGVFDTPTLSEQVGLLLNPDGLDLRLFLAHWHLAFAVEQDTPRGMLRSLQFYDEYGDAVHKLYLQQAEKLPQWQALLHEFDAAGCAMPALLPPPAATDDSPGAGFVPQQFAAQWLALQDVHQFHGLLRRHGLSRRQAARHAPPDHALRLGNSSIETLLRSAAARAVPIMVFVGNRGMIQIHTGPIACIRRIDGWLNILDPGFSLHLRDALIAEVWLLRRPGRDGVITSVEAFAADGSSILSLFGRRSEGDAERSDWRQLANSLPLAESSHA